MREERPEQQELIDEIDRDGDRILWQMQHHRACYDKARKAWLRQAQPVPGAVVRLPPTSMPSVPRNWPQNNQETGHQEESGDT